LTSIEPKPVDWLWPGWIPAGTVTVLDGDPGLGKSTLLLDLAARVSRGLSMPDGSRGGAPAGVVILSAEDDPARVIRPRLELAGADLERVALVSILTGDGAEREPTIDAPDLKRVEAAVREVSARLLVVDPLVAFLPEDVNALRDQDVRRALRLLKALAERTGCAVVVLRHWRKSESVTALYRGGGSIGIIAAARCGLVVARDPSDPTNVRRVLAVAKSNLAAIQPSRVFRLVADQGAAHPRVVWDGTSTVTADALAIAGAAPEERGALDEAKAYLRDALRDGEVPAKGLQGEAPCSRRTLFSAKAALGVIATRRDDRWWWSLPDDNAAQGTQENGLHSCTLDSTRCDDSLRDKSASVQGCTDGPPLTDEEEIQRIAEALGDL